MSNGYMTDAEAIAYGRLAVDRIATHCRGLDPNADASLDAVADTLNDCTTTLVEASQKAAKPGPLFKEEEAIVAAATAALTRATNFLKSRPDSGGTLAEMLAGKRLAEVKNRRAVLLVEALDRAVTTLASVAGADEHTLELMAHGEQVRALVERVHTAQVEHKSALTHLKSARTAWMEAYRAGKRVVKALLTNQGRTDLLVVVFQDLAVGGRRKEVLVG